MFVSEKTSNAHTKKIKPIQQNLEGFFLQAEHKSYQIFFFFSEFSSILTSATVIRTEPSISKAGSIMTSDSFFFFFTSNLKRKTEKNNCKKHIILFRKKKSFPPYETYNVLALPIFFFYR